MITTETSQNHVIAAIQAGAQGDILQPFTRETFEAEGAIVWREKRARYMGGKAHAKRTAFVLPHRRPRTSPCPQALRQRRTY